MSDQLQFSYSRTNLGIAVVFSVLSFIAVVLRIVSRRSGGIKLGADDYLIVVVLILMLGVCIMSAWAAVNGGLGVPHADLDHNTAIPFLKQTWVQEVISTPAIGLIKVCVCLFYRRIFTVPAFKMASNIMIAASIMWTIAFTCTLAFSLLPVSLEWSNENDRPHSLDFAAMLIAMITTDLVLDMVILSMPFPMIRKLHMPPRKKVMLSIIFGLGAFCVVASAVRLVFIVKFLSVYGTSEAFSRDQNQIAIWSNIEPCASIVAACLPTYGPLFRVRIQPSSPLGTLKGRLSNISLRQMFRISGSRDTGASDADLTHNVQSPPREDSVGMIKVQKDITVREEAGKADINYYVPPRDGPQ